MSNHLGDTNEMVDTPRTETYVLNPLPQVVSAEWARQLERELNAANESFRKLNIHTLNLVDRIRRLEEAGDALLELCEADESKFHLADHIDARCAAWRKAKEAKP